MGEYIFLHNTIFILFSNGGTKKLAWEGLDKLFKFNLCYYNFCWFSRGLDQNKIYMLCMFSKKFHLNLNLFI